MKSAKVSYQLFKHGFGTAILQKIFLLKNLNHLFKICQCSEQFSMGIFFLLTLIYCNILDSFIVCSTMNDTRRIAHLLLFRMLRSVQRRLPYSVCPASYSLSTESTIYHSRNAILRTGALHLTACIDAIRGNLTDNFCSKKIVTVPLIVVLLSEMEQSAGPTQDNQLAHSFLSCIHFSRSCDSLIVMGYFNMQPMKTVLKSSSSSSSSFYIYNS